MTAGNEQANTSSVIVALPAASDPVHDMGPEDAHCTLVWLGDASDSDHLYQSLQDQVAEVAGSGGPVTEKVSGRAELGKDSAQVLLLDASQLVQVRSALLQQAGISEAHENATQFPTWTPHLTLGYPGQGEISKEKPDDITFDRLALWHGDQQTEYPLGGDMTTSTAAMEAPASISPPGPIPWHGVLTIEGGDSGDGRSFSKGALRNRDLPLPLTWQKASAPGHDGSVMVANIVAMKRMDGTEDSPNLICAYGYMAQSAETDEVIRNMAMLGNRIGVSVDLDDTQFDFDDQTNSVNFTDARVCSASIVLIPAFAEAFVSMGLPPAEWDLLPEQQDVDLVPAVEMGTYATQASGFNLISAGGGGFDARDINTFVSALMPMAISESPWDGSSSRFTNEQWRASCILHLSDGEAKADHKLPIKEPNGDLSRAGVHAAAGRISQVDAPASAIASAKSALRGAYKKLGETPPDSSSAEIETFDRGPGWVTNPESTRKIHSYWTAPGQPGFAKIAWGTPGDFDRCRVEVGKYLTESGEPQYINQTCAQWHHDALGIWPATHAKEVRGGLSAYPRVSLVASGAEWVPSAKMFANPHLPCPTPLTYQEIGSQTRVFGHIAEFHDCHIGFPGVCVEAPRNFTGYREFHRGKVMTDEGIVYVGQLSLGGGHADTRLGLRAALDHYDNVATAVADVVVGDDEFGIWFSGFVRPSTTEQQRYELQAATLSGDWREKHGQMELVAACAVNVGGFTVIPGAATVAGEQIALVAAGMIQRTEAEVQDNEEVFAERRARIAYLNKVVDFDTRMSAIRELIQGGQ